MKLYTLHMHTHKKQIEYPCLLPMPLGKVDYSYLWSKMNINVRQKTSLQAFKDAIRGMNLKGLMDGSCNCKVCQS